MNTSLTTTATTRTRGTSHTSGRRTLGVDVVADCAVDGLPV